MAFGGSFVLSCFERNDAQEIERSIVSRLGNEHVGVERLRVVRASRLVVLERELEGSLRRRHDGDDANPRRKQFAGGSFKRATGAQFSIRLRVEINLSSPNGLTAIESYLGKDRALEPAAKAKAREIMLLFNHGTEAKEFAQHGVGNVQSIEGGAGHDSIAD